MHVSQHGPLAPHPPDPTPAPPSDDASGEPVRQHHDGWANWPSAQAPGWNSAEVGPMRDLVGELVDAIRASPRQMRVGLYHSLVEWFNPLYLADREAGTYNYSDQVLIPMLHDIVNRYRPSVIWSDGTPPHWCPVVVTRLVLTLMCARYTRGCVARHSRSGDWYVLSCSMHPQMHPQMHPHAL